MSSPITDDDLGARLRRLAALEAQLAATEQALLDRLAALAPRAQGDALSPAVGAFRAALDARDRAAERRADAADRCAHALGKALRTLGPPDPTLQARLIRALADEIGELSPAELASVVGRALGGEAPPARAPVAAAGRGDVEQESALLTALAADLDDEPTPAPPDIDDRAKDIEPAATPPGLHAGADDVEPKRAPALAAEPTAVGPDFAALGAALEAAAHPAAAPAADVDDDGWWDDEAPDMAFLAAALEGVTSASEGPRLAGAPELSREQIDEALEALSHGSVGADVTAAMVTGAARASAPAQSDPADDREPSPPAAAIGWSGSEDDAPVDELELDGLLHDAGWTHAPTAEAALDDAARALDEADLGDLLRGAQWPDPSAHAAPLDEDDGSLEEDEGSLDEDEGSLDHADGAGDQADGALDSAALEGLLRDAGRSDPSSKGKASEVSDGALQAAELDDLLRDAGWPASPGSVGPTPADNPDGPELGASHGSNDDALDEAREPSADADASSDDAVDQATDRVAGAPTRPADVEPPAGEASALGDVPSPGVTGPLSIGTPEPAAPDTPPSAAGEAATPLPQAGPDFEIDATDQSIRLDAHDAGADLRAALDAALLPADEGDSTRLAPPAQAPVGPRADRGDLSDWLAEVGEAPADGLSADAISALIGEALEAAEPPARAPAPPPRSTDDALSDAIDRALGNEQDDPFAALHAVVDDDPLLDLFVAADAPDQQPAPRSLDEALAAALDDEARPRDNAPPAPSGPTPDASLDASFEEMFAQLEHAAATLEAEGRGDVDAPDPWLEVEAELARATPRPRRAAAPGKPPAMAELRTLSVELLDEVRARLQALSGGAGHGFAAIPGYDAAAGGGADFADSLGVPEVLDAEVDDAFDALEQPSLAGTTQAAARFAALAAVEGEAPDPWAQLDIHGGRLGPLPRIAPRPVAEVAEVDVEPLTEGAAPTDAERALAERPPRAQLAVKVGLEHGNNFFTGFSGNISSGGLFVATHQTLPIGSQVELFFEMPDGHAVASLAEVRWVREYNPMAEDAPPGMGFRFVNLRHDDNVMIERYIDRHETIFFDE